MKKILTSAVIVGSLFAFNTANAGGYHHHHRGNDFGRFLGYTAAAAVTVGAASYIINSGYNNSYDRGYNDRARYENARREQEAYDRAMRQRYYYSTQPRYIEYRQYPVYQERVIYLDRPVYRVNGPVYNYYP